MFCCSLPGNCLSYCFLYFALLQRSPIHWIAKCLNTHPNMHASKALTFSSLPVLYAHGSRDVLYHVLNRLVPGCEGSYPSSCRPPSPPRSCRREGAVIKSTQGGVALRCTAKLLVALIGIMVLFGNLEQYSTGCSRTSMMSAAAIT